MEKKREGEGLVWLLPGTNRRWTLLLISVLLIVGGSVEALQLHSCGCCQEWFLHSAVCCTQSRGFSGRRSVGHCEGRWPLWFVMVLWVHWQMQTLFHRHQRPLAFLFTPVSCRQRIRLTFSAFKLVYFSVIAVYNEIIIWEFFFICVADVSHVAILEKQFYVWCCFFATLCFIFVP